MKYLLHELNYVFGKHLLNHLTLKKKKKKFDTRVLVITKNEVQIIHYWYTYHLIVA